jgi:hypothetical protein
MESPPPEYDRIVAAISSVQAPHALRSRIESERERTLIRRMVVKRMKLSGVLAGAAAVLGVGVALVAPSHGAPSSLDAAALATRGVMAAAPRVDPSHEHLLAASIGGVPFPRWEGHFPWKPSGQRTDELDGRSTQTVFYDGIGQAPRVRLAYTIVAGAPLAWPDGARTVTSNGVAVHVLRRDDRIIATWRAHGHTCVISAPASVPEDRMVALASYDYVT